MTDDTKEEAIGHIRRMLKDGLANRLKGLAAPKAEPKTDAAPVDPKADKTATAEEEIESSVDSGASDESDPEESAEEAVEEEAPKKPVDSKGDRLRALVMKRMDQLVKPRKDGE